MIKSKQAITSKTITTIIQKAAIDKKAENVSIIPIDHDAGIADWFVICEGDNNNHTRAICDGIEETLRERQQKAWHIEGREEGNWIVIDYVTVVVHIMTPEIRQMYALEKLWEKPKAVRIAKAK